MSGTSEKTVTSAGCPATTSSAWVVEAPKELVKVTPWPAGVATKAFSSAVKAGPTTEYPTTLTEVVRGRTGGRRGEEAQGQQRYGRPITRRDVDFFM